MMKTAVVTGGASGIGRRTVERLLHQGWQVWCLDLSAAALSAMAEDLGAGSRLRCRQCDVSEAASVAAAFEAIGGEYPKVDALICSAGVVRIGSLEEHTPEDVDLILGVNVKGPWLSVRAAAPLLRQGSSVDDPARVVIVGSIGGIRPKVGSGFYSASKAAVHVLTGIMAVEMGPSGVLVNAVAPGTVATPMAAAAARHDFSSAFKPSGPSPLGRIAQADDVADVIFFFLSDAAKYVNGTVLPVDGGTRAAFLKT